MSGETITGASARVVIVPAYFALRNLSYSRRIAREWISPSGARVTSGDGTVSVPRGKPDRFVLIMLATRACEEGGRGAGGRERAAFRS